MMINLGNIGDPPSLPDKNGWVRIGDYEVRLVRRQADGGITREGVPNAARIDEYARSLIGALPEATEALRAGKQILLNASSISEKVDGAYRQETPHRAPKIRRDCLPTSLQTEVPEGGEMDFASLWERMLACISQKIGEAADALRRQTATQPEATRQSSLRKKRRLSLTTTTFVPVHIPDSPTFVPVRIPNSPTFNETQKRQELGKFGLDLLRRWGSL